MVHNCVITCKKDLNPKITLYEGKIIHKFLIHVVSEFTNINIIRQHSFIVHLDKQAFISKNSRRSVDPSSEFTKEPVKELILYTSV